MKNADLIYRVKRDYEGALIHCEGVADMLKSSDFFGTHREYELGRCGDGEHCDCEHEHEDDEDCFCSCHCDGDLGLEEVFWFSKYTSSMMSNHNGFLLAAECNDCDDSPYYASFIYDDDPKYSEIMGFWDDKDEDDEDEDDE